MARAANYPSHRQRLLTAFAGVALGMMIVAALYVAQTIFIPVALAIFLTFLMAPIVERLQRWRIGRAPAVVLTVILATVLLIGLGWVVTRQVTGLTKTLSEPEYAQNIANKVHTVEGWMQGGVMRDIEKLAREVKGDVREKAGGNPQNKSGEQPKAAAPEEEKGDQGKAEPAGPPAPAHTTTRTVEVVPAAPSPLAQWPESLGRVAEPLAQAALVFVLVIFMLMKREDLRNRLIRLIGHGRITVTTKAIDDAAGRVSRFLFMQLIINATYGLVFAAGLYLIGVPYAFLWGFLAAVMRYVPYVGIWLAVLPPIALSLAVAPGWTQPLWVVGLVAVLELVTANFAEPLLFGHSIGVSEVALLISAAFWAWLWGPIGLVLSAPLTVCLVVLGKYVPQLEFFDTLLGDTPALPPRLVFYQRLLARDQDEAADVIEAYAQTAPPEQAYDEFLVPALVAAKRDRDQGELSEPDERFIIEAVGETAEELSSGQLSEPPVPPAAGAEPARRVRLLGCPARDAADELALRMLGDLLDPDKWEVEILTPDTLSSELLARAERSRPAVICVGSLPPGGLAHTRYLCKRLRHRFPQAKIVVGLWGLRGDAESQRTALAAAGADFVATTLLETRAQLTEWHPVFLAESAPPAEPRSRDKELAGQAV